MASLKVTVHSKMASHSEVPASASLNAGTEGVSCHTCFPFCVQKGLMPPAWDFLGGGESMC